MSRRKISKKRGHYSYDQKPVKKKGIPTKYYPIIWCIKEKKAIGMSTLAMKFKADNFGRIKPKHKVNIRHWRKGVCAFLSEEYEIDMRFRKKDEEILCPKCSSPVDFRLFPSSELPRFVKANDTEDNTEELPDS